LVFGSVGRVEQPHGPTGVKFAGEA
jgi:hypothetical protein